MTDRLTLAEAQARIEDAIKTMPGTYRVGKLGVRREGVPGTGGGTFAMSFVRGRRNRQDGRNYVEVPYA